MRAESNKRPRSMTLRPLPWLSVALLIAGWWWGDTLPPVASLHPDVLTEPQQTGTQRRPFKVQAEKIDYTVTPVQDYAISGLVVSHHDTSTWWNWLHAAANDHLNVADLCMVWGANARSGAYTRMSFSSGQFVCYVSTRDPEAARPDNLRALSNNHLLTDSPAVARHLRGLRVGDQVTIRGELAEYRHRAGFDFFRGTSLTRDDQGNGACETIFVRDVKVLRSAPLWPQLMWWAGLGLVVLSLGQWWNRSHRRDD